MREFISYERSLQIIDTLDITPKAVENVFITEARGRVLAQDIKARQNNPSHPTSAMDGYALMHKDIDKIVPISGDNPAGSGDTHVLQSTQAIKTFTGSLMPKNSDTLVPIENVEVIEGKIEVKQKVPKGFAVRGVGEIYKKDEVLLKKNTPLTYAQIGVLASLNIAYVKVYQKPKVAIASSGSEILELSQPQTNPSQIRSSNHIILEVLAKDFGCEVAQLGVVADDKECLYETIQNGLKSADIVVTTGGVSVGDYDFTKEVLLKLGAKVLFHGVKIKPGQHLLLAQKDDKFILSLPGFAYSATVTFMLYLLPLVQKLQKGGKTLQKVTAKLTQEYRKKGDKKTFVAVNCNFVDGEYRVDLKGKKEGSSAIVTNLLNNAALMMLEEDKDQYSCGEIVEVILLDSF